MRGHLWWLAVSLGVFLGMQVLSWWPDATAEMVSGRVTLDNVNAPVEASVLQSAKRAATIGFSVSLEAKENADFLLTPALLSLESASVDVIVTYPSE
jgi:hypothetical protein